jgi:PAS domain S-box-containing protein
MTSSDAQHLAAIVESTDDAIVGADLESIVTSWNQGAKRLFGYSPDEVIGQPLTRLIPPERMDEEARAITRIRGGEHVHTFQTVRLCKGGTLVDVSVTLSPIRDARNTLVGLSTIAREALRPSGDDRAAAEIRDRLAFLAEIGAVLGSSLDYAQTIDRAVHLALPRLGDYCNVLLVDESGALRHVAGGHVVREKEPVVLRLARMTFDERPGTSLPTFAEAVMKARRTVVASHEDLIRRISRLDISTVDPELRELGATLAPWAYIGTPLLVLGRPAGVISFGTTETESKREYTAEDETLLEEFARRASAAIQNARLFRQIEDLGRLKDEFLATLSHELRTPLSAILGWARMLASGHLDPDRSQQAVDVIVRNAQVQAKLVDDVLDVARGMAGNLRLEMAPVDLVTVAQRGVEAIAPAAAAKRIAVEVRAATDVPVTGDAGRLQQIAWNLLSNAVKFTPAAGRVLVEVSAHEDTAELRVTDSGSGIAPAFLPYVFDKFRQGDASATRQHGGLGLGLAIARHLAEMHGGSIEAQSEGQGRGATFRVTLPLRT